MDGLAIDHVEEFDEIIAKVNPTINMTIIYDPKLYKDTLTNITSLLQGNYTNMLITSEEFEIDFKYYITSKVLFGTQIGMSIFFMAFNSIKSYLPLPDKLLNFISTTKMFLGGGSFFLHQYAIKKCSQSNAFEVYVTSFICSSFCSGTFTVTSTCEITFPSEGVIILVPFVV